MTTLHLRRRYLLALGLSTHVLGGCASSGDQQASAEPTTTAAKTAATSTAAASSTATVTATATATATAASSAVAFWEPKVPDPTVKPLPDPGRSLPTCPNGNFCVAQANATGPNPAEAPFQTCAASIPFPSRESGIDDRKEVRFDAATTKRERTRTTDACCYTWWIPCPGGRPLVVQGTARTAQATESTAWIDATSASCVGELSPVALAALADHYAAEASYEHASVASFARVSLSLLAVGAPADLVAESHRAALDEVAHARAMYSLASACRGEALGPGPLDLAGAALATSSVVEIAEEAFLEGCVGEVTAALVLHEESGRALSQQTRMLLETMAQDEERHAELAWRTVAWALTREPALVRQMLERASAALLSEASDTIGTATAQQPSADALPGVTTPRERALIRARAILEVTTPCLAALLANGQTLVA